MRTLLDFINLGGAPSSNHVKHVESVFDVVNVNDSLRSSVKTLFLAKDCTASKCPAMDRFVGKYYFNDDTRMNFVKAEPFASEEEKASIFEKFSKLKDTDRSLPAMKVMMRSGESSELFCHDVLYNIEIESSKDELMMRCWTGDMQMDEAGQVSSNQAKGRTVIRLRDGKASMNIGGGWGAEKWVMDSNRFL